MILDTVHSTVTISTAPHCPLAVLLRVITVLIQSKGVLPASAFTLGGVPHCQELTGWAIGVQAPGVPSINMMTMGGAGASPYTARA